MAPPSRSRCSVNSSTCIWRPGSAGSSAIYRVPRLRSFMPRSVDWGGSSSRSRAPPLRWIAEGERDDGRADKGEGQATRLPEARRARQPCRRRVAGGRRQVAGGANRGEERDRPPRLRRDAACQEILRDGEILSWRGRGNMLVKKSGGARRGTPLAQLAPAGNSAVIDRRSFLRRSGIAAGGLGAALASGGGPMNNAQASPPPPPPHTTTYP